MARPRLSTLTVGSVAFFLPVIRRSVEVTMDNSIAAKLRKESQVQAAAAKAAHQADQVWLMDHQVARRYNVSRATVWRWVRQGLIPSPVRITAKASRWYLPHLDQHDQEVAA